MSRLVNRIIKEELKEFLVSKDFTQLKPKLFVRIRENLIDVVRIEMGRYGKTIYLNYFINLLPAWSPEDVLTGSSLGDKVGRNDEENFGWSTGLPEIEEETRKSIISIKNLLGTQIIPWFNSIKTIKDFIVEDYLIHAKKHKREVVDFSCDFDFKLIGKDYQNFLTILHGVWSPCFDKKILYQLIEDTKNIENDENWIESLRQETIKVNKLEKLFQ